MSWSTSGSDLQVLTLTWESGPAFLEGVVINDDVASFRFTAGEEASLPAQASVGQIVSVTIRLQDSGVEFHVHARVIERVSSAESAFIRLEFLRTEQLRQELVLAAARGEIVGYRRRRAPRFDLRVPVRVRLGNGRRVEATGTSVSAFGIHLDLWPLPEMDELLKLSLRLPGQRRSFELWARVASRILTGPQRGVGLEFAFDSVSQRNQIAETIAKLEGSS